MPEWTEPGDKIRKVMGAKIIGPSWSYEIFRVYIKKNSSQCRILRVTQSDIGLKLITLDAVLIDCSRQEQRQRNRRRAFQQSA